MDEWLDKDFCDELTGLRNRGEGPLLEFKQRIPKNISDLAAEIAAFASTDGGTILIGISDDGVAMGIPDGGSSAARDQLCGRIEGISSNAVRPSTRVDLRFGLLEGNVILGVNVPKGAQPIYYANQKPYVRHGRQARPAEPDEVIERIETWLKRANPSEEELKRNEAERDFNSALATALISLLISADQFQEREYDPWADRLRHDMLQSAENIRALAASRFGRENRLSDDLRDVANLADKAANFEVLLGGDDWETYGMLVKEVGDAAACLKARIVDPVSFGPGQRTEVFDLIKNIVHQLEDIAARAESIAEDQGHNVLQEQVAELGGRLLRLSFYNLESIEPGLSTSLRSPARALNLIETEELYLDGGASAAAITQAISEAVADLSKIVAALPVYD